MRIGRPAERDSDELLGRIAAGEEPLLNPQERASLREVWGMSSKSPEASIGVQRSVWSRACAATSWKKAKLKELKRCLEV